MSPTLCTGLPDGIFAFQINQFVYVLEGLGMESAGIFYSHLVHFVSIWYSSSRVCVNCTKKNLAILPLSHITSPHRAIYTYIRVGLAGRVARFCWYNIPKGVKDRPNNHKIDQIDIYIICRYTNTFHCKTLQN
jgi:hypothetical protein